MALLTSELLTRILDHVELFVKEALVLTFFTWGIIGGKPMIRFEVPVEEDLNSPDINNDLVKLQNIVGEDLWGAMAVTVCHPLILDF